MPLVEYDASSSSDEDNDDVAEQEAPSPAMAAVVAKTPPGSGPPPPAPPPQEPPLPPPDLRERSTVTSLHVQTNSSHMPSPSIELPDAALLLSSPSFSTHQLSGSDHFSRVAAAMAENASRKRASNGSVPQHPQVKHHKGRSPLLKNMPDQKSGLLIPPQLQGRTAAARLSTTTEHDPATPQAGVIGAGCHPFTPAYCSPLLAGDPSHWRTAVANPSSIESPLRPAMMTRRCSVNVR